jgi:uncharacterized RDD family membrane protein YckC
MDSILIPIVVCFLLPVGIVFLALFFKDKRQKERYEIISKAMDKGIQIDPSLLEDSSEPKKHKEHPYALLTSGLCLTLGGIALFLLLYFLLRAVPAASNYAIGVACSGLIPAFVGIGLIVSFYMGRRYARMDKAEGIQ